MKAKDLKSKLALFIGIIKNKMQLPVLEYVLIQDGIMWGTNLWAYIAADISGAVSKGQDAFLLPFNELKTALNSVDNNEDVSLMPGKLVVVGKHHFTFSADQKVQDWPKQPKGSTRPGIALNPERVARLIALFNYTSNDELRPAMCGIYFDKKKFCATNAHVLRAEKHGLNVKTPFILHNDALRFLKRKAKNNVIIQISDDNKNIIVSSSSDTFIVRNIDEQYPDYEAVIPTDKQLTKTFHIERAPFIANMKSALAAANKVTHQVRLTFSFNQLAIQSEDLDENREFSTSMNCATLFEEDQATSVFEIGFNAKLLLILLEDNPNNKNMVTLRAYEPNRAALLDEGLIMPVMLNNYV